MIERDVALWLRMTRAELRRSIRLSALLVDLLHDRRRTHAFSQE